MGLVLATGECDDRKASSRVTPMLHTPPQEAYRLCLDKYQTSAEGRYQGMVCLSQEGQHLDSSCAEQRTLLPEKAGDSGVHKGL